MARTQVKLQKRGSSFFSVGKERISKSYFYTEYIVLWSVCGPFLLTSLIGFSFGNLQVERSVASLSPFPLPPAMACAGPLTSVYS